MPKGSCKMLPLTEKVKVLNLMKEKKNQHADVAKIYSKNKSCIHEIMKKEKKYLLGLLPHLRLQNLQL
jgi:hypothetical protein